MIDIVVFVICMWLALEIGFMFGKYYSIKLLKELFDFEKIKIKHK